MSNILERLDTVADHLEQAALVQNCSASTIKLVCAMNAKLIQKIRNEIDTSLGEVLAVLDTIAKSTT